MCAGPDRPPDPFESWFEVDVALDLAATGLRVVPQFEIAGYRIDLVVEGEQARLAVECDGDRWHGADRYEADLDRQRKLERAGWTFARVRGSAFYANSDAAMTNVWDHLADLGITQASVDVPDVAEVPDAPDAPGMATSAPGTDGSQQTGVAVVSPTAVTGAVDSPGAPDEGRVRAVTHVGPSMGLKLEPYADWDPAPMEDPRSASADSVLDGLMAIVEVEGPVIASRACQIYAKAAGIHRVRSELRRAFNRVLSKAKRSGVFEFEQSDQEKSLRSAVIRVAGSPPVRPRTAGSRSMSDIPESEVARVMRKLVEQHPSIDDEDLYRRVLELYGFQRLRQTTRDRLTAIRAAIADQRSS